MKPVLRVIEGPGEGGSLTLSDERPSVVGRLQDLALTIDDQALSRRHFELRWDGLVCRLADLDSTNGTYVNGESVAEAILKPGDQISAGGSEFLFEDAESGSASAPRRSVRRIVETDEPEETPPPETKAGGFYVPLRILEMAGPSEPPAADPPPAESPARKLAEVLDPALRLYALVDGAQEFSVAFMARTMGSNVYTLFSGELAESLAHVGPCLVDLGADRLPFLQTWLGKKGGNVGVLLETPLEAEELCVHLRQFGVDESFGLVVGDHADPFAGLREAPRQTQQGGGFAGAQKAAQNDQARGSFRGAVGGVFHEGTAAPDAVRKKQVF